MNIVKLNNRHKQFKEHGHTFAFRFNTYTDQARRVERACSQLFRHDGWNRDAEWYSYFGSKAMPCEHHGIQTTMRPFWVTVKDESAISAILLTLDTN
jgi:hypothetical protein